MTSRKKSTASKSVSAKKPVTGKSAKAVKKAAPAKKKATPARKQAPAKAPAAKKAKKSTRKQTIGKSAARSAAAVKKKGKSAPSKPRAPAKKAKSAPSKPRAPAKKAKSAPSKPKAPPAKAKTGGSKKKVSVKKAVQSKPQAKTISSKRSGKAAKTTAPRAHPPKAEAEVPEEAKQIVLGARKRHATPSVFKPRKSKNTPIVFTMEDVAEILDKDGVVEDSADTSAPAETGSSKAKTGRSPSPSKAKEDDDAPVERKNHGTVSVADILGFNPSEGGSNAHTARKVAKKWSKYHKALVELRDHVSTGLALHSADTLKRSNKEDSGDLSGYGQHSADAGTDTFYRDLALSLVSNEQEALYEIEEAIQRIYKNTYGVCEITGEPIDKERLSAVPFTRYSLEGQRELERNRKHKANRGALLSADSDETFNLNDEDSDN